MSFEKTMVPIPLVHKMAVSIRHSLHLLMTMKFAWSNRRLQIIWTLRTCSWWRLDKWMSFMPEQTTADWWAWTDSWECDTVFHFSSKAETDLFYHICCFQEAFMALCVQENTHGMGGCQIRNFFSTILSRHQVKFHFRQLIFIRCWHCSKHIVFDN